MSLQSEDALASAHIPNLRSAVPTRSDDLVAISVELEGDDLATVTFEAENFLSALDIPQLGCVVHGASGDQDAMGVELQANDLHLVSD